MMVEESWKRYSTSLERLLSVPTLRSQVEENLNGSMAIEMGIEADMLDDLKRILLYIPRSSSETENTDPQGRAALEERALSAEEFFTTTFGQLRRAANVTTLMSGLIFLMGLVLLGFAAAQSVQGETRGTAIALAASGIAAIAAAFYRSPVQQVRLSVTDMQRSSMILMSYMLGLSLLSKSLSGKDISQEAEQLTKLTSNLATLLNGTTTASDGGLSTEAESPPA